ncbi:PREDICTED: T-complex protein 11 X-linked protein 1, partial [Mandrillus leucophaeus]|uniref:T-complex protein 11 X-linked protein 1 n=1 Tax=Mandrillus leucophaeus TaxID=9568 RepID=UPI0005F455B5
MPKTEETVFQNDPSVAENGAPEPKTPGQSQKSKSFCLHDQCPDLIETVNEVSKLSIAHEIVVNQDFYVEETILPSNRYRLFRFFSSLLFLGRRYIAQMAFGQ